MTRKKRSFEPRFIPIRLNLLFGLIVLIFMGLIARLGYMQIVNKDFYIQKMRGASQTKIRTSSVRGQIYDAQGQPLVENETKQVVSFTRNNKMTAANLKSIAEKLVTMVGVGVPQLTERQLADYYLADEKTFQKVVESLPKKERYDTDGNYLPEATIYANAVKSIDVSKLAYSDEEKKVIGLFSQMNKVGNFQTGSLKTEDLTAEQIAQLAANEELPGISTITSWNRKVLDTPLASIVGTVSSEEAGLPAEEVDEYLKKGYSLNDRVGTSYLEKSYEEILQGERAVTEVHLDKAGNLKSMDKINPGKKGKNVKLTVDLAFQSKVEDILKSSLTSEIAAGKATYTGGVYAVALNPQTGAVLALAGMKHDTKTGQVTSNALGAITDVFVPGSVVKGATLTTAWANGIITGNQVLTDQALTFQNSKPITSWFTQYGNRDITAVEALEYSSNTYMVQLALNLLGTPYGSPLKFSETSLNTAMDKLRSGFAQYGMGTSTGIDLPNESLGFVPKEFTVANYMTNSFGQFDNYTPLQLAQYVATIANDGKRLAPHIVEGIYDNDDKGKLGKLISLIQPKELNQVDISEENLALIKQGFYQVVHGSSGLTTGRTLAAGEMVPISAKTGTAETTTPTGQAAVNTNVVAYAPSNNPQIAVAVVFPTNTDLLSTVSHAITRDIINAYQELHPMN